jgi:hypothetical protein
VSIRFDDTTKCEATGRRKSSPSPTPIASSPPPNGGNGCPRAARSGPGPPGNAAVPVHALPPAPDPDRDDSTAWSRVLDATPGKPRVNAYHPAEPAFREASLHRTLRPPRGVRPGVERHPPVGHGGALPGRKARGIQKKMGSAKNRCEVVGSRSEVSPSGSPWADICWDFLGRPGTPGVNDVSYFSMIPRSRGTV